MRLALRGAQVAPQKHSQTAIASSLNDRVAREHLVQSAELAALWIAFCMRSKQAMTAHLLAAVAGNPQQAEAVGLIGGSLENLDREIRTFLDAHAPKYQHAVLPERTRGLVKATRRIGDGASFPAILATDARYEYLAAMLRRNGFAACLPPPPYSLKQRAARLFGLSARST